MSNPSSPTFDEVIGNVVEEVLRERTEEQNQGTALKVMLEEIEVVVQKGAKAFHKHLAKKGFVEERGFKQLVSPFKEEIEGWG